MPTVVPHGLRTIVPETRLAVAVRRISVRETERSSVHDFREPATSQERYRPL
jgi:hypothetical protein